ncbi:MULTISPECIES: quinol oxidase [Geobacter]|uniref:Quinol oxidase n=2 Tax=Geobacter TaxID=28231 RepID=A0A0C1TTK0_9BACT|nr:MULTISPECIES: quinol oxidase [Geobacter]ANA40724.1 quinol oxidase [Geobacter anodireducens]KIE42793.1 quinol oxidase [Geobacter soli]MBE2889613.1 quinol oxidase [Geobacter anodireducens]HMN02674.1 quinol oxidase [Geobacter anodireducens]
MKRLLPVVMVFCMGVVPALGNGAGETVEFRATIGDDGVQRVRIVGGEYYYRPNHIIVKVNVPVEITAVNDSRFVPHDLIVKAPEAGMDFRIDLKKEAQMVRFTPTKVGVYPMYCDKKLLFFASHREKGMEGVIEVVE